MQGRPVAASTKYWFDTEFIEPGDGSLHLLSIGFVAEDGREYYAVNRDCPVELADEWVREHVLPQLHRELPIPIRVVSRPEIRDDLLGFLGADAGEPEFWAYYASYDWVLFGQLFGRLSNLPESWPRYCRDLRLWADFLGIGELPIPNEGHHHALWDARWNRAAWHYLDSRAGSRRTSRSTPRVSSSSVSHRST